MKKLNFLSLSLFLTVTMVMNANNLAKKSHTSDACISEPTIAIEANDDDYFVSVTRGPWLQQPSSTSIIIKWYTSSKKLSTVKYGTSKSNLNKSKAESGSRDDEHELKITGLKPNTKYYYSIGETGGSTYFKADSDVFFKTTRKAGNGVHDPVRVWLLGDAGTANSKQKSVRDAYLKYAKGKDTDFIMFLGDNAYNGGKEHEVQDAVFDMYDDELAYIPAYSTLGNHDAFNEDVYMKMWSFPEKGELGGVKSNTENYYSFDHNNIHFIVLDSETDHADYRKSHGKAQLAWLKNDIKQTKQDWIVAIFHHPPYTKGSHDSDEDDDGDSDIALRRIREKYVPVLEEYGTDLIMNGHSHSYERSYYINGHYGDSDTFSKRKHTVGSTGDTNGRGSNAYKRAKNSDDGAVYVVAGSSGKTSSLDKDGPHEAMYKSVKKLGSCVLETSKVSGGVQTLEVKFIDDDSDIEDSFEIKKDVGSSSTPPGGGDDDDDDDTPPPPPTTGSTKIAKNATWRYYDLGKTPPNDSSGRNWKHKSYSKHNTFKSGNAQLGYGESSSRQNTKIGKAKTAYFRKGFNVTDKDAYKTLGFSAIVDDGMIVYLNGKQIWKYNMPNGGANYNTLATKTINGTPETTWMNAIKTSSHLVNGRNVIAVEVHQSNVNSSDLAFNLEVKANKKSSKDAGKALAEVSNDELRLYPVPTQDILNVKVSHSENLQSVKFFNVIGTMVKESQKEEAIDVSDLAKGMYVIEVSTDATTYYKSIVKE